MIMYQLTIKLNQRKDYTSKLVTDKESKNETKQECCALADANYEEYIASLVMSKYKWNKNWEKASSGNAVRVGRGKDG